MTRWLDEQEARAWRGYQQMRTLLDLQISRDLARDAGLSDADYTVLVVLSEAPDDRLRLVELAGRMLWSKSRVAHHLDRMQRRDLIRRESSPADPRACLVTLTEHGRRVIEGAAPAHVESVRRHLLDMLTQEQVRVLGDVAHAVVERLRHLADGQRPPSVSRRRAGST